MKRYKKRNTQRINQILMSSFLVFLMVFSVLGYVMNSGGSSVYSYDYNGVSYDIDAETNILVTEVDGRELFFYNYPESVIRIPENAIIDLLSANTPGPFLTFDPNSSVQDLQVIDVIRAELDSFFLNNNIFLSSGVYPEPLVPYNNFPVIDCVNATRGSPVIKFVNSSVTSVVYEDYCLKLEGNGYGLIELRDSLLYSFYGLI